MSGEAYDCENRKAVDCIKRLSRKGRLENISRLKFLTGNVEVKSFGFGNDGVNTLYMARQRENENNATIMKLAMPNHCAATSRADSQIGFPSLEGEYKRISALYLKMPNHVLKPLLYDKDEKIVLLEYQKDYGVMWSQLQDGHVDMLAIQELPQVLSDLHNITSAQCVPSDTASCWHQEYEESANHQSDLIFVQPYTTISTESNTDALKQPLLDRVHGNTRLMVAVDRCKSVFKERKDSLIHGDLHLGNILACQGQLKLWNFSFMRNGPRSFDLGLLLAGYMAMYHLHMMIPEDNDDHRRISYKMMDACRSTVETYCSKMSQAQKPEEVVAEIAGFAGCELVRRAIGVNPYPGTENRPAVLKEILESGLRLLTVHQPINDVGRLLLIALALC